MQIGLINVNSREIGRISTTNPPLGLLYLASITRQKGYKPIFIDADIDNLSSNEILAQIKHCKVVGITMVTMQASFAYKLIKKIKTIYPNKTIIVGGPHPSGMKERIFEECPEIDISVIGEGEATWTELLSIQFVKHYLPKVKGIIFKDYGYIHSNEPREPIKDLDTIPFPAIDLATPINRYKAYYPPNKGELAFPIIASRGCPFHCEFCGTNIVWHNILRFRSPKNIVDEIQLLHEKYGVDEIYFLDDSLNLNRNWFIDLCNEIIFRGLNKKVCFKGSVRANRRFVNVPIFKLAKEANFWSLAFGGESGVQKILNNWNKNLTIEEIKRLNYILQELGFERTSSFILGNPEDNVYTIMETIKFAKSLDLNNYDFPLATPLPGTLFEKRAKELKLIKNIDWSQYAMGKAVCKTKHLSTHELEILRFYALWRLSK